MDSARGKLLIAGPSLLDPNFWRTVVLVVEHTDEGALGLVLNRPSETTVSEAVPQLEELVELSTTTLFIGGPVQPSALIVLGEFEDPTDAALLAFDDVGVLGTGATPERVLGWAAPRPRVRRPRRLGTRASSTPSSSAATGSSSRRRREDAFTGEPSELWASVLTRKGGSYALVARMPPDPSVN